MDTEEPRATTESAQQSTAKGPVRSSAAWRFGHLTPWGSTIAIAAALSFVFKIYISLKTFGTNDVLYWQTFVVTAKHYGGTGLYHEIWYFNHPPFMIHVLYLLDLLGRVTNLGFPFWLRIPAICADLGSVLLVWKILRIERVNFNPAAVVLMAVAPTSIMVSGFHGNTDPLMIFFVLLSVYFIEKTPAIKWSFWVAGIAMGMSMNIKIVPVIFLPALLLYLPNLRARIQYFGALIGTILVASLPYVLEDPIYIATRVLGYGSLYGQWGLSRLLLTSLPQRFQWINAFYADYGKYLIVIAIIAASVWMNKVIKRSPLFIQLGFIVFIFLCLTPGFGIQYLAWTVPWVIGLGITATAVYYLATGLFQFLVYTFWSGGFPWFFADSDRAGRWGDYIVHFEVLCWAATVGITLMYVRFDRLAYSKSLPGKSSNN
jgi:hypothetical protein